MRQKSRTKTKYENSICHLNNKMLNFTRPKFQAFSFIWYKENVFQSYKNRFREKAHLKKSIRKFERSRQTTAVEANESRWKGSNTKIQTFGLTRRPFSVILSHFKSLSLAVTVAVRCRELVHSPHLSLTNACGSIQCCCVTTFKLLFFKREVITLSRKQQFWNSLVSCFKSVLPP